MPLSVSQQIICLTAVAEFMLSAYSLRKFILSAYSLRHIFGINKTLNVGAELEIFIPIVKD